MQDFDRVVITKQVTQQSAISTAERLGVEGYGIDRLPTAAKPDCSAPVWLLSIDAIPSNASILWASLSDACVDDNGCIDDDWLLFDSGTDRERIWAWFEREFNVSVAWLMGLAKSSREATAEDHFHDQIKKIRGSLETFPGDTYEGDITGHGPRVASRACSGRYSVVRVRRCKRWDSPYLCSGECWRSGQALLAS